MNYGVNITKDFDTLLSKNQTPTQQSSIFLHSRHEHPQGHIALHSSGSIIYFGTFGERNHCAHMDSPRQVRPLARRQTRQEIHQGSLETLTSVESLIVRNKKDATSISFC
ncbi:hypothetical protein [Fibrobacter sp. UWEL]|uniref:hypothetical protein n=1 Tax=Fibrobacter sp. UWEL TaxID=1896209 RepID=UPI0011607563|nr:hypothetical protein [Fibrobacter sp. UWEL]